MCLWLSEIVVGPWTPPSVGAVRLSIAITKSCVWMPATSEVKRRPSSGGSGGGALSFESLQAASETAGTITSADPARAAVFKKRRLSMFHRPASR